MMTSLHEAVGQIPSCGVLHVSLLWNQRESNGKKYKMFCTETSILESPVLFILELIFRIGLIVQCVQLVSNLVLNIKLQTVYRCLSGETLKAVGPFYLVSMPVEGVVSENQLKKKNSFDS